MTLPEVANYLGLAERTIYQWAQQGKLPAFKLGSSWRFRKSDVDRWLETQRTGPELVPASYLTDSTPPPPSRYRANRDQQEADQARVAECEEEILKALSDETRDVWTIEQFEDIYTPEIAAVAIEQLRKAKEIAVAEEKGLRDQYVKVIRRA
jgi:excisionase family DNA binding protein